MRFYRDHHILAAALFVAFASSASADVFNMASNEKSLDFVTVGNAGNVPDTTGLGAVDYTYQLGEYDVTAGQYVEFLNAVAKTDPNKLYYPSMSGTAYCNITRSGSSGSYVYSTSTPDRPLNFASFGDAARFCNWLTNGQPTGTENPATTEDGSYYLNGITDNASLLTVVRKAGAKYVLPTENEWYKAAYYDPNKSGGAGYWLYPTRSDTAPTAEAPPGSSAGSANYLSAVGALTNVGAYTDSAGPYGTFDQGGLLYQWTDTLLTTSYSGFAMMNSSYLSGSSDQLKSDYTVYPWSPTDQYNFTGFRVAEVPEPSAFCLLMTGIGGFWAIQRNNRRRT